ncbi:UNVERIFIED_ORG: hypothetical protein FHW05_001188 [Pantoea agglomerans]
MNDVTCVPDGELYDATYDERILHLRDQAKALCYDYNLSRPDNKEARLAILQRLLKKCGNNPVIEPPFYCDYGANIRVGDNFYANHHLVILDGADVVIGDNVFLAPNVGIYTAGHPLDSERRNQGLEYALPVTIGNNVWIGAGVSIVPGITIGNDVVIGAGSVVVKDIPSGVLAAGNPCRIIREINDEDRARTAFCLRKAPR